MYLRNPVFPARFSKILHNLTIETWVDLGFRSWKTIYPRMNRIYLHMNMWPSSPPRDMPLCIRFLKEVLENKDGLIRTIKIESCDTGEYYYADFHVPVNSLDINLVETNQLLKIEGRIENFVCINDLMVFRKLAHYRFTQNWCE